MTTSPRVSEILSTMSLAEKVGQLFLFTWRSAVQSHNDLRLHPAGFIRIYSDVMTTARDNAEIQPCSRIPMIMAADFERGIGGTIAGAVEVVTAMALGATADEQAAYDAGHMIGKESRAMGINMDYAPVLDVNSNPDNPIINNRAFGSDPMLVARMGVAFARGLMAADVAVCGKHFPGHGNTNVDSHSLLGSVPSDRNQFDQIELPPFRAAIKAGFDAIMSAHLLVPAIEPEPIPATLSRRVMTGLLREELGFKGVAVTDALEMAAVADNFPPEISIPMAVNAGCDQLIMPQNNEFVVDVLLSAVKRGDVTEDRINEAVSRILSMKENRRIFDDFTVEPGRLPGRVLVPEHIERAREIAELSITLIDNSAAVPVKPGDKICCINVGPPPGDRAYFLESRSFASHLASGDWSVNEITLYSDKSDTPLVDRPEVSNADAIILAIYVNVQLGSGKIDLPEELATAVDGLFALKKPVIVASFGSPYVCKAFPEASARLCAFSATQASQRAMARAIKGEIECRGVMPVSLD